MNGGLKNDDFTKKALIFYFLLRWEERWEHLQLILEVYQFARDAAVAEAWLMAQDPYLKSEELGQTIDEVENLIKKHEAFEKAAAAQEERFAALERLTTVRFYIEGYFFWQQKMKLHINTENCSHICRFILGCCIILLF